MRMEEFIKQSMDNFKEVFGEDRLHDHEYTYIAQTLEAAWSYGNAEGTNQAYEKLVRKFNEQERVGE
ncbi:hypothetical protein [Paenibacillus terreus]|uniref:hypothetical protein n=1 Tax=Paenibacillus terreus TaxID=1387834 RepID=UPI0035CCEFAC